MVSGEGVVDGLHHYRKAIHSERDHYLEGQRPHSSSARGILNSVSSFAHAIFQTSSKDRNHGQECIRPPGVETSMVEHTPVNRPLRVPQGATGNASNPKTQPALTSVHFVSDEDKSLCNTAVAQPVTEIHCKGEQETIIHGLEEDSTAKIEHQKRSYNLERKILHLESSLHRLEGENLRFRQDINTGHKHILAYENEIKVRDNLRDEQQKQEEQVRLAQQGSFRHLEPGKWTPIEDSTIRSELTKLFAELRVWAKRFSSLDMSVLQKYSAEEQNALMRALAGSVSERDMGWINTEKMKDKSPFLLTQALLAANITNWVFADPFFFFRDHTASLAGFPLNYGYPGFGINLYALYQEMKIVDLPQAHAWRCETLRLLNTPTSNRHSEDEIPSEAEVSLKSQVETMIQRMCQALTGIFLQGPVQMLLHQGQTHEEINSLESGLHNLFSRAGEISTRLWTQRTSIEQGTLYHLQTFSVDNEYMTAHRLHKLDDDDHRLDGRRIVAVIQPAIPAAGNNEGQNYDKFKVWSKAVVLVDDFDEE